MELNETKETKDTTLGRDSLAQTDKYSQRSRSVLLRNMHRLALHSDQANFNRLGMTLKYYLLSN